MRFPNFLRSHSKVASLKSIKIKERIVSAFIFHSMQSPFEGELAPVIAVRRNERRTDHIKAGVHLNLREILVSLKRD